ncbi:protein GET1 [Polychaeton citri CBS 116435]|uniref:Protein GET1 n=1 Tax=Polychaeton citri CBS 116435 TaxID=1314669 RepID=A0A9P4QAV7_9PEZI|nr:protein GET1 [Polychaeton citri CBS 116435]
MPSLLFAVFLLNLTIHLINTIGTQTIPELLWLLYTRLPTPQSAQAKSVLSLRTEVVRLHREMGNTSAQDDFAKWAKLRRAHDKAKAQYESKTQDQQAFKATFDRTVGILRWLGTQGIKFFLQWWFAKQAMFWLPQGLVPHPVEWLLSCPRAPLGSVSINVWNMACTSLIAMLSEAIVAVWTLESGKVKEGRNKGEKVQMGGGTKPQTQDLDEKKEL